MICFHLKVQVVLPDRTSVALVCPMKTSITFRKCIFFLEKYHPAISLYVICLFYIGDDKARLSSHCPSTPTYRLPYILSCLTHSDSYYTIREHYPTQRSGSIACILEWEVTFLYGGSFKTSSTKQDYGLPKQEEFIGQYEFDYEFHSFWAKGNHIIRVRVYRLTNVKGRKWKYALGQLLLRMYASNIIISPSSSMHLRTHLTFPFSSRLHMHMQLSDD